MGDVTQPQRPPTPWWVKVFAIVALVVGVLVVLKLTGIAGEGHGPGRHGRAPRPSTVSLVVGSAAR